MSDVQEHKDLSTFSKRFFHFLDVTDPRSLFTSYERIKESQVVVANCKRTGLSCGSSEEMALHQKLVDAAVHPVSGEIIPPVFRVSAIAPVNIPIVFLMLTCPPSNMTGTLFLHWLNQSYNTACNYYNRAGGGEEAKWESTAKAYGLAVTSACTLAFGLGKAFEVAPPWVRNFGVVIPCLATAAANVSNLALTRYDEIADGALVVDENGITRGKSKIAGQMGVAQTALTRAVLVPCSCLLLPPVITSAIKFAKLAPRSPRGLLLMELGIIYASLQAALPAALAVYPQRCSFDTQSLEPEFRHLRNEQGKLITRLYSNKGL